MPKANSLNHGGVMVNYRCNASCRHCLYSCSPARKLDSPNLNFSNLHYINSDNAGKIGSLLKSAGCYSVHIGGGEPFLDFEGLLAAIKELLKHGIHIEYIETNAFWVKSDADAAAQKINRLLNAGITCFCISIDPFHAEFVPYSAPLELADLCRKNGMDFFLWKQEFYKQLSGLDGNKKLSKEKLEKALGKNYIAKTARQYGISYGGRAINIEIEQEIYRAVPFEQLLEKLQKENMPCKNLLSGDHFHVDLEGFFIPPRCTGIILPLDEVISGIPEHKYPVFEALYKGGVSALVKLALNSGYDGSGKSFPSICNLCFHLRHFLSDKGFSELDRNHYTEALTQGTH